MIQDLSSRREVPAAPYTPITPLPQLVAHHPRFLPFPKPWDPEWAPGRREHSLERQTNPLLPPPPHQCGEASVPSQQRLQEFGEACGREGEGGKTYQGGWRKTLSSRLFRHRKACQAQQPSLPCQKHSSKVSKSAAFNRDGASGRVLRVLQKSDRLVAMPQMLASGGGKLRLQPGTYPPWPP